MVCACLLQDGQEFLKLLLSKLEVVFAASQREVGENRAGQQSPHTTCNSCVGQPPSAPLQHPCSKRSPDREPSVAGTDMVCLPVNASVSLHRM